MTPRGRIIEAIVVSILLIAMISVSSYLTTIMTLVPHPKAKQDQSRTCRIDVNISGVDEPSECETLTSDSEAARGGKWNNQGCLCLETCVAGICQCPFNGLYTDGNYSWAATTEYDYGNATNVTTCRVWPTTVAKGATTGVNIYQTFIPTSFVGLGSLACTLSLFIIPKAERWPIRIFVTLCTLVSFLVFMVDFCMVPWKPSRTITDYWILRMLRQLPVELMVPVCLTFFHRVFKMPYAMISLPYAGIAIRVVIGVIAWAKDDANLFVITYNMGMLLTTIWLYGCFFPVLYNQWRDMNHILPILAVYINYWAASLALFTIWTASSMAVIHVDSITGTLVVRGTEGALECWFFCCALWMFGGWSKKVSAMMGAAYQTNHNSDAILAAAIATTAPGDLPTRPIPAPLSSGYKRDTPENGDNTTASGDDTISTLLQTSGNSDATTSIEIDRTAASSTSGGGGAYQSMYPVAFAQPTSSSSSASRGAYAQLV